MLHIPPFPYSRTRQFATFENERLDFSDAEADSILDGIRRHRLGGTYWSAHPACPKEHVLVRVADPGVRDQVLERHARDDTLVWLDAPALIPRLAERLTSWVGECDPWHAVAQAKRVIVDSDDVLAFIAALSGITVETVGEGRFRDVRADDPASLRTALRRSIPNPLVDPFSGSVMPVTEAVELCGMWRELIDSNRDLGAAVGFGFWKRETVAPLLWGGSSPVRFLSSLKPPAAGERIAVWKARTPPATLKMLEAGDCELLEVEDGFIRSIGLGADCVAPLSIVADRLGAHFDPGRESELERLLQTTEISAELCERAARLRQLLVQSGLSKYGAGGQALARRAGDRRHVLVPGQVEDDRSVILGGGPVSTNLELLRRVRALAPDAYIIYKAHPDVVSGHRVGIIPKHDCLSIADEIADDAPIAGLIEMVDEVHVNTSLAGFEALIRGKVVTTHGVPFYAGWGLTTDFGPVPGRRSRRRSLDELVAATLLMYPRYLDPVTGLPCPPEVLAERLSRGTVGQDQGALVALRRLQGRARLGLSAIGKRLAS